MSAIEEEGIIVRGTLTYKDYRKHNSYHQKRSVIVFFMISLLLMGYYFANNLFSGDWLLIFFSSLILGSIPAGLFSLLLILMFRLKARKEYQSDQLIKNEIIYVISDKGISQNINRSNVYIEWDDIIKVNEHHELFQLYISKNKAIVLMKRFFKSEEEGASFKQIATKKLSPQKLKLY